MSISSNYYLHYKNQTMTDPYERCIIVICTSWQYGKRDIDIFPQKNPFLKQRFPQKQGPFAKLFVLKHFHHHVRIVLFL